MNDYLIAYKYMKGSISISIFLGKNIPTYTIFCKKNVSWPNSKAEFNIPLIYLVSITELLFDNIYILQCSFLSNSANISLIY